MFDKDILSQLKSENGGLQTVLKNCADVFCGKFITGPPTHSVGGGQTSNGRWRLSSLTCMERKGGGREREGS